MSEIEVPFTCLASDDYNGLLRCRIFFWDGSYLDLYEAVSTEVGYPVRVHYAYMYLREGQRVFRHDNASHHPAIVTHPHHKESSIFSFAVFAGKTQPKVRSCFWTTFEHIGPTDRLAPADQPSFSQVLAEIEGWSGR